MIKRILLPLLVMVFFLVGINKVQALSGSYAYDITSVSISGLNLKVEGWAAVPGNNWQEIHNIEPKYTLRLKGFDANGNSVALGRKYSASGYTYANKAARPKYTEPCDRPNDYTKAYYMKVGDYVYPNLISSCSVGSAVEITDKPYSRAEAVANNPRGNAHFFININFEFLIPLQDLFNLSNEGVRSAKLELIVEVAGGTKRVYGKNFETESTTYIIPICIQQNHVNFLASAFFWATDVLGIMYFSFEGLQTQVSNIASAGMARPQPSLDVDSYWHYNRDTGEIAPQPYESWWTSVYYYRALDPNHGENGNYTIKDFTKDSILAATGSGKVYSYKVNVSKGDLCTFVNEPGIEGMCFANGGGMEAWIPSFWTKPPDSCNTKIIIPEQTCKDNPSCANSKLNNFRIRNGEITAYGETCPAPSCCTEICDPIQYPENMTTTFCTRVCNPNPTPPTACDDPDPMKKYCCNHPDDQICRENPVPEGEDPTIPEEDPTIPGGGADEAVKKSGTCDAPNREIKFKYPADGYGKVLLKNQACSVSCLESLKVTFGPSISVRAGMGFKYPIDLKGKRLCVAAYTNDTWQGTMNAAVDGAKIEYDKMVTNLKEANRLAGECGPEYVDQWPIPAYTATDTGRSCSGGEGCDSSPCRAVCDTCPDPHSYSSFNTYAMRESVDNDNLVVNNIVLLDYQQDNQYYPNGNSGWGVTKFADDCSNSSNPLLAMANSNLIAAGCDCETTHCSRECPLKTCYEHYCRSKSGDWWDEAQTDIASKLKAAKTAKDNHDKYLEIINQLISDRDECDNYVTKNAYTPTKGQITVKDLRSQQSYAVTSQVKDEIEYKSLTSVYNINFCNYGGHEVIHHSDNSFSTGVFDRPTNYCLSTYYKYMVYPDYWIKYSIVDAKYEFSNNYYIQKYTGDLSTHEGNGYVWDGRYEYTDYYAMSKRYEFIVEATRLGPNFPSNSGVPNTLWSIAPYTCYYDLDNKIFPPEGDENNDLYGNVTFMYRQISLTDPFPNRAAGANWQGKERLITDKNYAIYAEQPLYQMTLTPPIMQELRGYGTNYNMFYLADPYKSEVVKKYIESGIVTKRR